MEERVKILSDAMAELGWSDRRQKLHTIWQNQSSAQYFVAFIGQYSAGKSCLINNLLNSDVLPTGVLETTPLLTYIRYGDHECARLHYLDNAIREIPIAGVSEVVQNNAVWDFEKLDYLEIFLNSELLKSGLILLDTPGINTVIERHENLLATSFNLAARIIYVAGQAPHATDIEMIESLGRSGVEISFVRTHCDEIRSSEERSVDVVNADLSILSQHGVSSESCYHISNLSNSEWFVNIDRLRAQIAHIGKNVKTELEIATDMQLQKMKEDCLAALDEKRTLLESAKAGDDKLRQKKLSEAERNISRFESLIAERERKLAMDIDACGHAITGSVKRNALDYMDTSVDRIKRCGEEIQSSEQMKALMNNEAKRVLQAITSDINLIVNPILHGIRSGLQLESFSLDDGIIPPVESFAELTHSQDCEAEQLKSRLCYIRDHRSEVEAQLQQMMNAPAYGNLQSDLLDLEHAIQEAQQAYSALPPYTPQLVALDEGRLQPSQIAKMVGNVADWALLLVPGGAISGAIKTAADSSKLIAPLARLIGKSEKALSIIKNGDTVKDIAFALQNMTKTYATKGRIEKAGSLINTVASGTEKTLRMKQTLSDSCVAPSILDYFTIQHWTEQIGKSFDRPPKLVIDKEYEEQYYQAKNSIEQELRNRQQRSYSLKCKHQAFESEYDRLLAEKEASIVDERQVAGELERRNAQLILNAERQAYAKWKQSCGDWFHRQLSGQIDTILNDYMTSLSERLQHYQEKSISTVRTKLLEEQDALRKLSSPTYESQDSLDCVVSLISSLRGRFE